MSNAASSPIKDKATEWWQLISGEDTAKVYQEFFKRTWTILKETALLLWLLLCGVLVSVEWIWNSSSRVTESVSDLAKANKDSDANTMSEAGTKLWEGIQKGASSSVAKAREQLKMPASPPRAPKAAKAEPAQPASGKTPEQYAQEQKAKDEAAAKQKAEAEARAAQEKAAKDAQAAADNDSEASEEA